MTGSQIVKLGHVTYASPFTGGFVLHGLKLPRLCLCTKFEKRIALSVCEILRVPKFRNWITSPRLRALKGQFVIRGHQRPTPHLHNKFE